MITQTNHHPDLDRATDREPSITGLVSGIMEDVERLAEQQFALLRREMKEEMQKAVVAGEQLAIGAIVSLLAGIAAVAALSLGLWAAVPGLPLWVGFAIVGSILAIVSCALIVSGRRKASSLHAIPPLTLQTAKENLQCLTAARK